MSHYLIYDTTPTNVKCQLSSHIMFYTNSSWKCQLNLRLTFKRLLRLKPSITDIAANVVITRSTAHKQKNKCSEHTHSFRLIWWMRWDRWYYLGWVSVQRFALVFQVHLFFVWKVVITSIYCQPERRRAAHICAHPRLHPAAVNHHNSCTRFYTFFFNLKKQNLQSAHVSVCMSPSSSTRRPMLSSRASGL